MQPTTRSRAEPHPPPHLRPRSPRGKGMCLINRRLRRWFASTSPGDAGRSRKARPQRPPERSWNPGSPGKAPWRCLRSRRQGPRVLTLSPATRWWDALAPPPGMQTLSPTTRRWAVIAPPPCMQPVSPMTRWWAALASPSPTSDLKLTGA